MLAATAVITKVEYNKQLFEFTKKFVSKSNRKTFIPRTKDFLKRNKKKILIIFLVLFGIVAISFAVRGVQYSQKNAYAASLQEELQGKTYIHYYNSSYRTEWEVIEFNQDTKRFRTYGISLTSDGILAPDLDEWEDPIFMAEFFSGDVLLGYQPFLYDKTTETITLGFNEDEYVLASNLGLESLGQMYQTLLAYQFSENFKQADSEVQRDIENMSRIIENYNYFSVEGLKGEIYLDQALSSLQTQYIYGFSIEDLLNDCTRNFEYVSTEYDEDENNYIYTYTCDYALNKVEMPNYYVSGELIIVYDVDYDIADISGSAASALQTYAILRAFS